MADYSSSKALCVLKNKEAPIRRIFKVYKCQKRTNYNLRNPYLYLINLHDS